MNQKLPEVPKKKKIDENEIKALAVRVRTSFEDQKEYLRKKSQEDADRLSPNAFIAP